MAATPVNEDALLASQCLDFCKTLAGKSFSFSLKIGTNFSFSLDTRGEELLPSTKKKKQTPSTLRRNARRREQFLQTKLASTAPVSIPVSEQGTDAVQKAPASLRHHPSPPPSSERRQVTTVGRGKVPTFNQLDGAADSPAARSSVRDEVRPMIRLMPRCVFCPEVKNNAAMPHPCYLASTVSCPVCHVKGKEVGLCEECNHGFDHTNGKRDDYEGYPLLKCKSCK